MKLLNIRQYFIFLFLVLFSFTSILNLGASKNPDDELPGDVSDSSKTDLCKDKIAGRYTNECIAKCEEKADYSTNCTAALEQGPESGPPKYEEKPIVSEIKASLYKAMTDDSFQLAGDAVLKTSLASIDVTFNSDTYEKFQKLLFVAESTNAEVGSMRSLKEETGTSSMSSFTKEQQKENAELVVKGIIIDSLVEDAKLPTGAGDSIKKAMKSLRDNWVNYMHKEGAGDYGGETFFNTSSMEAMDTYSLAHHVYNAAKGIEAAMLKTTYPGYSAMTIAADEGARNAVTLSVMQKDLRAALIDTLVVKASDAEWAAEKNYTFTVSIIDNTNTAYKNVDKLVVDVTALTTTAAWTPLNKILNFDAAGIVRYTSAAGVAFDDNANVAMQEAGYLALTIPTPEALFPMKELKKPGATADADEVVYTGDDKKKLSYMLMEKKAKVIQKKLYNLLRDPAQTAAIIGARAAANTLAKALFDQALDQVTANAGAARQVREIVGTTVFDTGVVDGAAAITVDNLTEPAVVNGLDNAKILIFKITAQDDDNITAAQLITGLRVGLLSHAIVTGNSGAAGTDAQVGVIMGTAAAAGADAADLAAAQATEAFLVTNDAVFTDEPTFADLPGLRTAPLGANTPLTFYNLVKGNGVGGAAPNNAEAVLVIDLAGMPAQDAGGQTHDAFKADVPAFATIQAELARIVAFVNNVGTTADTFDTLPAPMRGLKYIASRVSDFFAAPLAGATAPCYLPLSAVDALCFLAAGTGSYAVGMGASATAGTNADSMVPTGKLTVLGQGV